MPEQSTPPSFHDDPVAALLGRISAPWWVVILSAGAIAVAVLLALSRHH